MSEKEAKKKYPWLVESIEVNCWGQTLTIDNSYYDSDGEVSYAMQEYNDYPAIPLFPEAIILGLEKDILVAENTMSGHIEIVNGESVIQW